MEAQPLQSLPTAPEQRGIAPVREWDHEPGEPALCPVPVWRINEAGLAIESDLLAVEEPLQIRLGYRADGRWMERSLSITMRTPGHDEELAVGFLVSEGIVTEPGQIARVHACPGRNMVRVELQPSVGIDWARLERHFYASSSCGVCGKASIQAIQVPVSNQSAVGHLVVDATVLHRLPETLRAAQTVFARTGGLHAAALFDVRGTLRIVREDVGRHNALDKLVGAEFLAGRLPLQDCLLLVSGRASFELVQKAVVAGIPILAAVGAPSSLAVSLARKYGLTLLGFVRSERFNVYSSSERIREVRAAMTGSNGSWSAAESR